MDERALNGAILAALETMPAGGGYRFEPVSREPDDPINPRDPHYDGVLTDLRIGEARVARAAADGATYCCGMTLQVWLEAYTSVVGREPAVRDPEALVAEWFCPVMGHPGVAAALVQRGLGVQIAPEDARAGDLVQYWRSTDLAAPSGHSAVFLEWLPSAAERRRLRYWSSQPATGGIGVHTEAVGPGWELHFVRALRS